MKKSLIALSLSIVCCAAFAKEQNATKVFADISATLDRVEELMIPDSELTREQLEWRALGYPLFPVAQKEKGKIPQSLWFKPVKLYTAEDWGVAGSRIPYRNKRTVGLYKVPDEKTMAALVQKNDEVAKRNRDNPVEYKKVEPKPIPRGARSEPFFK